MNEPRYAAHERIFLRGKSIPEGSPDEVTFSLYEQLTRHVIRAYPSNGPLRSIALRKLAESLNDILDHAELTHLREAVDHLPKRTVVQTSSPPAELTMAQQPVTDGAEEAISEG